MITLKIPTFREFWLAVLRFSYKRVAVKIDRAPVGIPGMRDPENICRVYEIADRSESYTGDCGGDGHYLCKDCSYFDPEADI